MRMLREFSVLMAAMLCAGSALALSGPKVAVTYSMEERDGGQFIQEITGTALGAGDNILVYSIDDDCQGLCGSDAASNIANIPTSGETVAVHPLTGALPGPVVTSPGDNPMRFTIEFTADGAGNIVTGPVELVGLQIDTILETLAAGGLGTAVTDNNVVIGGPTVTGNYDGTDITWSGPWSTITTGSTQCGGSAALCNLGAPVGGWPRIESGVVTPISNGNPAACPARPGLTIPPVPVFSVGAGEASVQSDNNTPGNFQDDILTNCDNQAITYTSWNGVEISRQFTAAGAVPFMGPAAQLLMGGLIAGSGGLMAWRRSRKS